MSEAVERVEVWNTLSKKTKTQKQIDADLAEYLASFRPKIINTYLEGVNIVNVYEARHASGADLFRQISRG